MQPLGRFAFAATALLALALAPAVSAQQPPSSPSQQKKAKQPAKRVWTDDDLQALHKPWDDYADQKAQAEQASSSATPTEEKTAPAKKEKPVTRDEYIPPKTADEAQSRAEAKQREINYQLEAMERKQQEYESEPNEQVRQGLKKKLDQMNTDLKEAQTHLKLIETKLKEMKSKSPSQAAPEAGAANQPPASPPLP
jgi:hypothetical protein